MSSQVRLAASTFLTPANPMNSTSKDSRRCAETCPIWSMLIPIVQQSVYKAIIDWFACVPYKIGVCAGSSAVEQLVYTQLVGGSIPSPRTICLPPA